MVLVSSPLEKGRGREGEHDIGKRQLQESSGEHVGGRNFEEPSSNSDSRVSMSHRMKDSRTLRYCMYIVLESI